MTAKKKGYVFNSPTGGALSYPTDDGVETFESGVPREADAKLVKELRDQGFEIKDADVEADEESEESA